MPLCDKDPLLWDSNHPRLSELLLDIVQFLDSSFPVGVTCPRPLPEGGSLDRSPERLVLKKARLHTIRVLLICQEVRGGLLLL